jgi:Tfp pilus assembly protein PilF
MIEALQHISLGHQARRAGRDAEALAHYLAATVNAPKSVEARTAYGLMLMQMGRIEQAEHPLREAVALAPKDMEVRFNLAHWCLRKSAIAEARSHLEVILRTAPEHPHSLALAGDIMVAERDFGSAASLYERAAMKLATDPSIWFKAARAHFDARNLNRAEAVLSRAAELAPGHDQVFRLKTEILEAGARWSELEAVASLWSERAPGVPSAWRALALAQWETGRPKLAKQNFERAMRVGGASADTLATYGRLCMIALEYDAADAALAEAIRLQPDNIHALGAMAILAMFRGDHPQAEVYCRRAIEIAPGDVTALKTLVQLRRGRLVGDDFARLKQLEGRDDVSSPDKISVLFALAECLDAQKATNDAFEMFSRANALSVEFYARGGLRYDPREREREVDGIIAAFPTSSVAPLVSDAVALPIFVLGMPRSGTTLVESVIGAHSEVLACGERAIMRWLMQEFRTKVGRLGADGLQGFAAHWREVFWGDLPLQDAKRAYTDKNPWNYDAIGLIFHLFPNARIVHVQRNPLDTGFSIFRNEFSKFVPFTNNLDDIAHYYAQYARLMQHWGALYGDRVALVQYETFLSDFEAQARALVSSCGLDWQEACLRYWENDRVIGTLSTMQARNPPMLRAPGGGAYAPYLAAFARALESYGIDISTGALKAQAQAQNQRPL